MDIMCQTMIDTGEGMESGFAPHDSVLSDVNDADYYDRL
jgi:hypothetical protein